MKITPCLDQVLIEKIVDEKSKGGIILVPTHSNSLPTEKGKVIAVGPGRYDTGKFVETTLKVGVKCFYHAFPSGVEISDNGKKYIVVAEKQIVATVDE